MTILDADSTFIRLENSFGEPCTLDQEDLMQVILRAVESGLVTDEQILDRLGWS